MSVVFEIPEVFFCQKWRNMEARHSNGDITSQNVPQITFWLQKTEDLENCVSLDIFHSSMIQVIFCENC